MADIPTRNATTVQNWTTSITNLQTRVAQINAPDKIPRYRSSAQRTAQGIPTNLGEALMKLINFNVPNTIWTEHDTVIVNGDEYPEQFIATIPAKPAATTENPNPVGKALTINAGQRWLNLNDAQYALGKEVFEEAMPDDTFFVSIGTGSTLNLNADNTWGQALPVQIMKNAADINNATYQRGGKHSVVVTGTGIFHAEMGEYGNNVFVTADSATVRMAGGNDKCFYKASGKSTFGHKVTAGLDKADVFEYDFAGVLPSTIGANKFTAREGSTASGDADSIQLRALPSGAKVSVQVTALKTVGVLPDADLKITIKNAAGTTIGTIESTNVNYLYMIYADGTSLGVSPKTIGLATKEYTIGTTAPKSAAARSSSLAESEPSVSPVNLQIPKPAKEISRNG